MSGEIVGIRPAGDRAILVELSDLNEVLSLQAQLQENPLDGQLDVVAAALTVLLTADSAAAARKLAAYVQTLDLTIVPETDGSLVTIETIYDGEDLDAVAKLTGLGRDAVIAAHSGQIWTAAFGGFAPGFAYLVGENRRLEVPRKDSPRTAVPSGSVALAGEYSAVYPVETPGGWQLIGRTAAVMWNLDRPNPALVRPGNRVRFQPVREIIDVAGSRSAAPDPVPTDPAAGPMKAGLLIIAPGLQSTIQDLGRPGYADLGVTGTGALDRGALRRANRLAGNSAEVAAIEILNGGLVIEALADQVFAVTGALVPLSISERDGGSRQVATETPFALLAQETLALAPPVSGLRSYLAVRGGFDIPEVLGSRSTDTMSGIGPAPLAAGTHLAVAEPSPHCIVGIPEAAPGPLPEVTEMRIVPGPREDWFSAETLDQFCSQAWTVTPRSNRIGLRLDGEPLSRTKTAELASEGTVRGAVQIPPEGLPVLLLADLPVTGGYPVIGVVVSADLDQAAQLAPGSHVRFVPVPEAAPVPFRPVERHLNA
jgi:KipI family sensor histidine kinase inhibitor